MRRRLSAPMVGVVITRSITNSKADGDAVVHGCAQHRGWRGCRRCG